MSHANPMNQYDDDFVATSVNYGRSTTDLRMVRDSLNQKYSELLTKRSMIEMARGDRAGVVQEIKEVQAKIRETNDRIDQLLQEHLTHLKTNVHMSA